MVTKNLRILSLESKDIYEATQLPDNEKGYDIRDKNGQLRLKRFVNSYDWSLDSMKLQDVYERVTRKKNFFFRVNKNFYTQHIINVCFSYSFKEFNKFGLNTFVRVGFSFQDCDMTDASCVVDGKLVAIQTNVEVNDPLPPEILGNYFVYADGHYEQIGKIPTLKSRADLRQFLYENGFICDGIKYVRYKRSSGSSRVGKCLFVNEVVAEKMQKWDKCGLQVNDGDLIDLAAWEAYIALPLSSIIDTLEIKPEEILVVDDYDSKFTDEVIVGTAPEGKLISECKAVEIKNNIWDGQSLLCSSLFEKYSDRGMLVLRNRFFKTCAFNTNIQKWFSDNNITLINQLNGITLANDISQIKLITTPNSIKYLKFGSLEQWFANVEHTFGIVKHEKATHFFGGRMVQTHYQLLNTLQFSYEDILELLEPSLDYLNQIRSDVDVLRYHIKYTFPALTDVSGVPFRTKNDIVFRLLGINDRFAQTKIFKDFRNNLIRGYVRNLKRGHVLINGNYATLFGNPVEMLKASIGMFNGESSMLRETIYCKRFDNNEVVLASRSPHITMGNILLATNTYYPTIDQYFNLSGEIVCVNSINENISQRLNGCDFDSDAMLLTNNRLMIKTAQKNFNKFLVPVNMVETKKISRVYTANDKADLDVKTSVNKIGEIVNLSQQLNSLLWDRISNGEMIENCWELYKDICKMAVLSGVEIDRAKKEVSVNSKREIDKLANKYKILQDGKTVKPAFFKTITTENGFELSDNIEYRLFETPMDYLQQHISEKNAKQSRVHAKRSIPLSDVLCRQNYDNAGGSSLVQRDKIISVIKNTNKEVCALRADYHLCNKDEKRWIEKEITEKLCQCINQLNRFAISEYTAGIILRELDKKENKKISNVMFDIIFNLSGELFFDMIIHNLEKIHKLIEVNGEEGTLKLFDFLFKKEPNQPE